jgi:hypothetical protein
MTALILAVTGTGLLLAVLAWLPEIGSPLQAALSATMLTALLLVGGVVLFAEAGVATWGETARALLVLLAGGLAIAGGGPLTTSVLSLVDRANPSAQSTQKAGEVLRGGALIGALERGAIFATVAAGWPEGLAIVLAIKGLARYPELKAPGQPPTPGQSRVTPHAVAERFIIGTFTSVLWSVTCAALLLS